MHGGTEPLRADIHVDDDALGLAGQSSVAVRHGEGDHFVGTCYDAGECVFLLDLAFRDGFDDAGVVGAEVDEDVSDAEFYQAFEEGVAGCVPAKDQLYCGDWWKAMVLLLEVGEKG